MKVQLFSVYDVKSEVFQPPIFCHNVGHALRVLTDMLQRSDTMMSRFPVDYKVYHVGEFDDVSGVLYQLEDTGIPKYICELKDLVKSEEVSNGKGNGN